MNEPGLRGGPIRGQRGRWAANGQSYAELALALPAMVLLFVVAVDFGRLFYTYIGVINAARAGAQYGMLNIANAANTSGMQKVAEDDGSSIPNLSVTATLCTCGTPTSTATSCGASTSTYCTDDPQGNYVVVTATAPFATIVKYPGVPSSVTLKSQAVMQVEQQ
jgi:Flp pilus assembly protein TadG